MRMDNRSHIRFRNLHLWRFKTPIFITKKDTGNQPRKAERTSTQCRKERKLQAHENNKDK